MEHLTRKQLTSTHRLAAVAAALFLLLPALARAGEPYFSVSTDRTFAPGEKASIHLYTRNVSALEFRLYHVNDPMLFFEKLGDEHGFGHRTPEEQIEERSWLERFHDWKHGVWTDIRHFFRNQFSSPTRAEIRQADAQARKSTVTPATMFAQIPLLNPNQLVARWRQDMPPSYYSESQDVPVEGLEKGVYVAEATDGNLRAYTLVIVTELAVVTRTAPGQLLAFTVDRKAGNPLPNTRVELLASRKRQASLQTDAQGLGMISLPAENFEDPRIIAVHDKDVALVAPYYFNISSNREQDWTGYVYTDRPVYRPGHTVHFRGVVRDHAGGKYRVPAGESVELKVEDPNSKQVFLSNAVVSAFGSVHGDFTLPIDAAIGYYSVAVHARNGPEYGMNGGFYVEEYKKPEYEVRVIPDKARILQGDAITATIQAKYYFGEPVAGAQVKYVVHRAMNWSYFFPDQEPDEDEATPVDDAGPNEGDEGDYGGEQLSEQTGKLDANGQLKISIPTKLTDKKQDYRYRIEARVTDESRREIAGYNSVIATYGSFQVGARADKYIYKEGETINLSAIARDYDGHPVATAFHADLLRSRYYSNREEETVLASTQGQTGKDGSASFTLPAKDGGSIVRITAQTPEGRAVEGRSWLWIVGRGYETWGENRRQQIQIVADKKSYKAGDTAHLLIMAKAEHAQMLVTTEALNIQSKQVIKATGSSTMVSVPITSAAEPDLYVVVSFIQKNTLYSGTKMLKVPADEQKLNITLEPSQPQFKPGDAARYNITARDAFGKPVVGEFSLGVVDEAIYAIRPDTAGDMYQFFYGRQPHNVMTESSLSFYFTGEAGTKPMILAGSGGGGDGRSRLAQLKPSEPLVQPKVRKLFPDTALWLADIKTDQNGRAQATLTFPDSLTTWRATVRGTTADTKVGNSTNRVIVRKNLMVRLAVPRFFRQGDEVTVSTIVHNYLETDKTAQVSLDVKGLDLQDGAARSVTVPVKGDQRQDWQVRAQNVRESDLLAKALTNEESDALELTLPVIPFGVKLSDSKAGAISAPAGKDQATITFPGDPITSAPGMNVSITPSVAGSMFGALDYLTSYPYGCTEQTMSGFLPDIVVAKAMKDLNLQSTINTPELAKKIRAGLDRLYDFQHEDGGWGWWKDDQSMVFMTAYVVSGLAQARDAGYEVKDEALKNAEKWLKGQLQQHERMKPELRAYVIYALALDKASDAKMLDDAYNSRSGMSSQGLSMLGLALHTAGDGRDKAVAAEVEKKAIVTDAEARWPSDYDYMMEFYIDDSVESTAYALRLLSLTNPESPVLPKAALWLVNHRDGGYFWISTKQTAMVVFGLMEYMKVNHELDADFTADVYVNDKQVMTRHFTRADSMKSELPHIYLTSQQLQAGANTVRVQKSGNGRLYWSVRGEYYSADKRLFQNNKLSLNITREYYKLAPQQKDDRIVYDLVPLSGEVHSGDVVAVRLSVNGSDWRYLLVEDPIPAGAEFIQRDDLYELNHKTDWWGFWFTSREFHDDHAAFFQTYFSGHQEYVYLMKIVNPGKFRISPASVQPMYQPSIISTTDAATMEVKP